MKIQEKISYLQENHLKDWLKTRIEIETEVSSEQSLFCICKRLATGFHESICGKFQNRVSEKTVRKLNHLIESK